MSEEKKKKPTVKSVAIELLCEVDYYEDYTAKPGPDNRVEADHPTAGSVGLPYEAIVDRIKEALPDSDPSAQSLRWYNHHLLSEDMNGFEGFKLPRRRARKKIAGGYHPNPQVPTERALALLEEVENGMTPRDAGEKYGVNKELINAWIGGRRPALREERCRILEISPHIYPAYTKRKRPAA